MRDERIQSIDGVDGYFHLALGAVGSTNTEAMQLARMGHVDRLWVTATEQITGKARRGRSWVSKPGNLYSTLMLIDPAEPAQLATLPLVVSVALYDTLVSVAPHLADGTVIKWPNDILIYSKKTSGILLETALLPDGRRVVVIGCGLNCQHFPDNPLYPATSLKAEGVFASPEQVFPVFAKCMAGLLEVWNQGQGFSRIRDRWLARAKGIGEPITARFADHELSGVFQKMDLEGRLVLIEANGTEHRIAAADIFFGESGS